MNKHEMVMTEGPLLGKIIKFSLPIMFTGMIQIAFNAADSIVVGRYGSDTALSSVGATTSLIYLLINMFIGIAAGTTVAVSHAIGSKDERSANIHAHNAIATALIGGVFVGILGIILARPMLTLMDTPKEALPGAILYFRIYFGGAPVLLLYNFGAAIMRSTGDSRRPFLFLTAAGVINVILNLVFVLILKIDVAGVAIATVVSNLIAALLVLYTLMKSDGCCRVKLKNVRIYPDKLKTVLKFGIPAGLQNCMFSISNVLIQSSINSFGIAAIDGNTAAASIFGFYDTIAAAFSETAVTFTSQNFGAKKYSRIGKITLLCIVSASILSIIVGGSVYIFREQLLSIYTPGNMRAIECGSLRLLYMGIPHFVGVIMSVMTAVIRGIDKPMFPMFTTIFWVCIVRIVWIYTVFPIIHTLGCVYFTYPMTWAIAAIILTWYFAVNYRRLLRKE